MYHVNNDGKTGVCRAKAPEACRFYNGENEPRHFENRQEAVAFAEKDLQDKHGIMPRSNVRFSLVREFKQLEEQHNIDFDGFPTRFFNADLAGNDRDRTRLENDAESGVYFDHKKVSSRLFYSASSPKDADLGDEEVKELATKLGFTDIEPVSTGSVTRSMKSDKVWRMVSPTGDEVVLVPSAGSRNMQTYAWRYGASEPFTGRRFQVVDVRSMVGADRLWRKTGENPLAVAASHGLNSGDYAEHARSQRKAIHRLYKATQDAQEEGANFRAQKKYYRNTGGTVASAWEDKKHPDKTRQAMMADTKLNKHFSKVEIDNDVDPGEFADFEKSFNELQDKMPPIPKDRQPELRLRKLGKHNASGLFVSTGKAGVICVDIRDSSSYVHEAYHHQDLAVGGNVSLSSDFRDLAKDYKASIKYPGSMSSQKKEYYETPTEVHSRAAEIYTYERMGVRNRLVDGSKFSDFDYAPIQNNPELKKRFFDFFDKQYGLAK